MDIKSNRLYAYYILYFIKYTFIVNTLQILYSYVFKLFSNFTITIMKFQNILYHTPDNYIQDRTTHCAPLDEFLAVSIWVLSRATVHHADYSFQLSNSKFFATIIFIATSERLISRWSSTIIAAYLLRILRNVPAISHSPSNSLAPLHNRNSKRRTATRR